MTYISKNSISELFFKDNSKSEDRINDLLDSEREDRE